jgi:hypothetical protein
VEGEPRASDPEGLWDGARPLEEWQAWAAAHKLRKAAPLIELHPGSVKRAQLAFTVAQPGCDASLRALVGAASVDVLVDACGAGEERLRVTQSRVQAAISPDGGTLAVIWWVSRYEPNARGDDSSVDRIHAALVPMREAFPVDLLDGAALAGPLAKAGFTIGHRGRAQKAREQPVIYAAQGVEDLARTLAAALGLAPSAVQPLTWQTPFAITVAGSAR